MHRMQTDNAVRQTAATHVATRGSSEASPPKLSVVQDTMDSTRPEADTQVARPAAERTNRIFGWWIGVGLVILTLLLAVIMFNAGINVEVLP